MNIFKLLRKLPPIERWYARLYSHAYQTGRAKGREDMSDRISNLEDERDYLMNGIEEVCKQRDFFKKQNKQFSKFVPVEIGAPLKKRKK